MVSYFYEVLDFNKYNDRYMKFAIIYINDKLEAIYFFFT